uniref:Uncharacterized protein n=1 Tax=Clytia hemisphaerica TaxID=252671 RepID=A0A7M5WLH5_9CNID
MQDGLEKNCYRVNFLPNSTTSVESSWEDDQKNIDRSFRFDGGFSSRKRLYSIQESQVRYSLDRFGSQHKQIVAHILVCSVGEDCKSLNQNHTKLVLKRSNNADYGVFYDNSSGRWFFIGYVMDRANPQGEIVVYSGVVDGTEPDGTTIHCDQESFVKLRITLPPIVNNSRRCNTCSIPFCRLVAKTLVIKSPSSNDCCSKSILDLVCFNENEIFHLKRISINHQILSKSLFLDIDASIVYVVRMSSSKLLICNAIDFSGNYLINETLDCDHVSSILHIRKSFFLTHSFFSRQHVLKTFSITPSGITVLKTITLPTSDLITSNRFESLIYIVSHFNQALVCAIVRVEGFLVEERFGVWSYNLTTGEQKVLYRGSENEYIHRFDLSWNLSEIALWTSNGDKPEKHLKIVRLLSHDITLKHFARLACLRSFGAEYLNGRLPVCLQRYLGISE